MNVVAVEVTAECRACGGVIPFEGAVDAATCGACQRTVATPPRLWGAVLRQPSTEGAVAAANDESTAAVATEVGTFRVLYRRADVACGACGVDVPTDALADAAKRGAAFCVACGGRIVVRAAPSELPMIAFLAGEAPAKRDAPLEALVLPCSRCGAPLEVDGRQRAFSCKFCGETSTVPDAAWERLHPRGKVRRWYLACETRGQAALEGFVWKTVVDAVADEEGNVYAVGTLVEGEAGASLWSLDRELRVRWTKRGLAVRAATDVRLFRAHDCIGVWGRGARRIPFVSCVDGQTAFEYPPPSGATPVHVEKCRAIAADADGSILALVDGEQWGGAPDHGVFVRFTPAGEMLDVWPGVAALRPEPGAPIPRPIALGTAPTCVQGAASLRAGADGVMNLLAAGEPGMILTPAGTQRAEGRVVVRLRRDGAVNVLPPLPFGVALGGDASHKLWVLGRGGLLRVTQDGHIEQSLPRVAAGGVVGQEWVLAVDPAGTATLMGDGGAMRRLGRDGGVELVRE